ncbi:M4 family metallopeptidase [Pendulispora albinea]|uniref:M4 family metallopeptidase n=1 Tax=Pendulispora albinea TaxID=2741071 RepID=A0ABZ2LYR1_9BACT
MRHSFELARAPCARIMERLLRPRMLATQDGAYPDKEDDVRSRNVIVSILVLAGSMAGTFGCQSEKGPTPGQPSADMQQAVTASVAHLAQHAALYGLGDPADLKPMKVFRDEAARTHVRLQQTVKGVPVFGGEGITHLAPDGTVASVTDGFIRDATVDIVPTIPHDQAIAEALRVEGCSNCLPGVAPPKAALTAAPEADLWVFRDDGTAHLAWRVQLRILDGTKRTSMPVVFIDAHDKSFLWRYDNLQTGTGHSLYSGTVSIDTTSHSGAYYMEDLPHRLGTFDLRNRSEITNPERFTDADDTWDAPSQRAAVDVHDNARKTWEYLQNVLGRNGLDGNGGPSEMTAIDGVTPLFVSKVHFGTNYNNAFWDGTSVTYGDGNGTNFSPLVSLDVVAHEMMHGVTQHTANLLYSGQSGALNESYSDVFAALVERYVRGESSDMWKMGEQCFTPAIPGDAARHLDDPHLLNHRTVQYTDDDDPDHYIERYRGASDNGGVHVNSGIANKTFYLLAMGGSHHRGGSMTGIGIDAAAAIWYKALTTYMTSQTSFSMASRATYEAAAALYGYGSPEVKAVVKAWTLTGVGVDLTPPDDIVIKEPQHGDTIIAPTTIRGYAHDDTGIQAVEVYVDGALKKTVYGSPFEVQWNTLESGNGVHNIFVKAYDLSGNATNSASINVTVAHETTPPTTRITDPVEGQEVYNQFTTYAVANDNVRVARVEFWVDGSKVNDSFCDPDTRCWFQWDSRTAPNGRHTLVTKAYDTVGNMGESAPVNVVVINNQVPPTVSITSPAPGATVGEVVTIAAAASDDVAVKGVDFRIDGKYVGSVETAPYEYIWDTRDFGNGPHTLKAIAYDKVGNTATAEIAVTAKSVTLAEYDPISKAPRCSTIAPRCDTGPRLVEKRGPLEPNGPNTIDGCADGTESTGGYLWLDRVRIFTDDGTKLKAGKKVTIEANVFGSNAILDIYHAPSASNPRWTLIKSQPLLGSHAKLSVPFTLPTFGGGLQAIRGIVRLRDDPPGACAGGWYTDRDDVVFPVASILGAADDD